MKLNRIKALPIIIFLFLFIYMPFIISTSNILHILSLVSYIFITTKYLKSTLYILNNPALKLFILYHICSLIYILGLTLIYSGDLFIAYSHFQILFEVIPISAFISISLLNLGYNKNSFYNIILTIGIIQVIFVFFSMFYPSFRELLLKNVSEQYDSMFSVASDYRLFGLARGYTYSMPLFQGLCIIIATILGTYKSKMYFFLIPLYIFSIVVNARFGLISLLAVGIILAFYYQKGNFLYQIFSIFILLAFIYTLIEIVNYQASISSGFNSWIWMKEGINEITEFHNGKATGNLEALTNDMWFTPNKEYYLFGTGQLPYRRIGASNSDIGYVQIFYYGGIFYSLLVYMAYISVVIKLRKFSNKEETLIFLSILLFLFLANFKGNAFISSEHTNGIILLFVFTILWYERYSKNLIIN